MRRCKYHGSFGRYVKAPRMREIFAAVLQSRVIIGEHNRARVGALSRRFARSLIDFPLIGTGARD